MRRLYIFNPYHDLVLAHGRNYYNAPDFARHLAADMSPIVAWLCCEGDMALVADAAQADWLHDVLPHVDAVTADELRDVCDVELCPWGWNADLRRRLINRGVSCELMPDEAKLERWRELSHRRTSISLIKRIAELTGTAVVLPVEVSSLDELKSVVSQWDRCYVKMPWSGSGKGVLEVELPLSAHIEGWCEGALSHQGSLIVEKSYTPRALDFAMEMECRGGECRHVGYSVFKSDSHNQYMSAMVAPERELMETIIAAGVDVDSLLPAVVEAVNELIAPHYTGALGIDMLAYRDSGCVMTVPCVEVNLRHTMGHVTCALAARHGLRGTFGIEYRDKDGSWHDGRRYLTPAFSSTRYRAYIE